MAEKTKQQETKQKPQRDPISGIMGGLIVILLGVIFLLVNMEYFDWVDPWWAYFLVGLGFILIIDALIRIAVPQFYRPVLGRIIGGIVLIAVGAGNILDIENWWPLILIGVGLAVIITSLVKSRKKEEGSGS